MSSAKNICDPKLLKTSQFLWVFSVLWVYARMADTPPNLLLQRTSKKDFCAGCDKKKTVPLGKTVDTQVCTFIALDYINPLEIVHSAQIAWYLHHVRLVVAAKGVFWVAEAAAGLAQAAQWVAETPERVAERPPGVECSVHRRRGEDQHQEWPR